MRKAAGPRLHAVPVLLYCVKESAAFPDGPAARRMKDMAWRGIFNRTRNVKSDGVFMPCESCRNTLVVKDVEANFSVCPECDHHFRIGARRRIELTLDPESFAEMFAELAPCDPLEFTALRPYAVRLRESQESTGLLDAVVCGTGAVDGLKLVICITDNQFMMGSMGSVVGEKITRSIEHATSQRLPLVIFSGSGGGARMDEGALALMQMAKTSAALARYAAAKLPYISVITHPTYGGVSASFAMLGDVIIAEPRALMGFAGPRVIKETIKAELPEGFQQAEFMLEHGQIDMIVSRAEMRSTLKLLLDYMTPAQPATS